MDKVNFSRDSLPLPDFKSFIDEEKEMLKESTVELLKKVKSMLSRVYESKDILEYEEIQKRHHDRLVILFDGSQSCGRDDGSDNFGPWDGSSLSHLVDPLFTHFYENDLGCKERTWRTKASSASELQPRRRLYFQGFSPASKEL
jgi:hypothetical protein